jgi:hypothetical protein
MGSVEILIDKSVAEIFVDGGRRYIVKEILATTNDRGIELNMGRSGASSIRLTSIKCPLSGNSMQGAGFQYAEFVCGDNLIQPNHLLGRVDSS